MNNKYFFTVLVFFIASCQNTSSKKENAAIATQENKISFQSGFLPVNGLKMYYEIYGEGKPLVLIHGGGSTIQSTFGRVIPLLAKHRKIIAVELQAHGRTSDRDQPESFEQDADDVAALVEGLGIKKADFFGFSNGGNTTMRIAMRHPALVNKIIIGSAFFKREGMPPQFWESIKQATLKDMPQQLQEAYKAVAPDSAGLIAMFTKDKQRMVNFSDWKEDELRSIHVPALVITGDQDVVTPEHTVYMARLFPQGRLAIIPGGHGKYIGEITTIQGDTTSNPFCIPLIEEFLDKN